MYTISMNSKNSNTSDPHRLNVSDEIDFKKNDKHVALSIFTVYDSWKNIKMLYKNNKFKISAPA